MNTHEITSAIDAEITKLQRIRSLLSDFSDPTPAVMKRGRGRPKKEISASPVRRVMSAEARARIASAQKKRWAAHAKTSK